MNRVRKGRLSFVFDELKHARVVAMRLLDEHEADPDCDLAILCRQFLNMNAREVARKATDGPLGISVTSLAADTMIAVLIRDNQS